MDFGPHYRFVLYTHAEHRSSTGLLPGILFSCVTTTTFDVLLHQHLDGMISVPLRAAARRDAVAGYGAGLFASSTGGAVLVTTAPLSDFSAESTRTPRTTPYARRIWFMLLW
jgi:hypothetical protein